MQVNKYPDGSSYVSVDSSDKELVCRYNINGN